MPIDEDRPGRRALGRPRNRDDGAGQNTIKSLDRAMQVLEHLSENQGRTLTALAEETGQATATVYRILSTLQARGIVDFDHEDQVWHIGPRAFVIGTRFLRRTSLVERARPIMRRLMEATGETANLGIEKEGRVLCFSQVETHASIRAFFPPGTLSPMHASGIGKALLAQMDEARLTRVLARHDLEAFTAHSITDRSRLQERLAAVRDQGHAVDREQKNEGMCCIAAPVFDMNREGVAGISVSGPISRMTETAIAAMSRPVMEAARQLTAAIGGTEMPARA